MSSAFTDSPSCWFDASAHNLSNDEVELERGGFPRLSPPAPPAFNPTPFTPLTPLVADAGADFRRAFPFLPVDAARVACDSDAARFRGNTRWPSTPTPAPNVELEPERRPPPPARPFNGADAGDGGGRP